MGQGRCDMTAGELGGAKVAKAKAFALSCIVHHLNNAVDA
jgi:hypothetical protein